MVIGRLNAALLLISFGLILIMINLSLLSWGVLRDIARLWPILLVALGLELLFRRRYRLLGLTSTVLLMGTVWMVVLTHLEGVRFSLWPKVMTWTRPLPPEVQRLELQVSIRRGRFSLAGVRDLAVEARIKSWGTEPQVRLLRGEESLVVLEGQGRKLPLLPSDEWSVNLPGGVPISLLIKAGRADMNLDLRNVVVELSQIEGRANVMDIHLGPTPPAPRLEINSPGGSLRIVRPPGVGILIVTEGHLSSSNLERAGFRREDSIYLSPSYKEAPVRVYLKIRSDLDRLEVIQSGGGSDE